MPRRWRDLSQVERVGLYTRQSLYLVVVGVGGGLLLSGAASGSDTASGVELVLVGMVGVAFTVGAMVVMLRGAPPVRFPPAPVLALLLVPNAVVVAVALAFWGSEAQGAAVSVAVASCALALGLVPDRRLGSAVVAGGAVVFGASTGDPRFVLFGAVYALFFVYTSRASMWLYGIVAELDEARQAQSALAVAEERLRFSRDVHDVLGRRLSTIAVQAELAATLADRGDERAGERMLEVRGVAHESLREARELARGYRTTDFTKELEGARSLLRSAGMEVRADVDLVPRAWQEPAGWVVREAVTNVLRHSDAQLVEVTFADGRLRVANDGVAPGADAAAGGSGLAGLRERLTPLGGTLEAGPDDAGWVLEAHLPGSGPLSATGGAPR